MQQCRNRLTILFANITKHNQALAMSYYSNFNDLFFLTKSNQKLTPVFVVHANRCTFKEILQNEKKSKDWICGASTLNKNKMHCAES